jgi:hypothetical protein
LSLRCREILLLAQAAHRQGRSTIHLCKLKRVEKVVGGEEIVDCFDTCTIPTVSPLTLNFSVLLSPCAPERAISGRAHRGLSSRTRWTDRVMVGFASGWEALGESTRCQVGEGGRRV